MTEQRLVPICRPGQQCHRRNVAEWFEHELGIVVPELGVDRLVTGWQSSQRYAFWRPEMERRLAS